MRAIRRCASLLALAIFPGLALAWNAHGHAAVGAIAEAGLTPAARQEVSVLLQDDLDSRGKASGRTHLADVASWPDEIRAADPDPKAYKGWHVRANPVCSAGLGACPDGHCVDQLIIHYRHILADRSQPARARNEALKWVVHLVGDLHQPLHSGVNANGGSVRAELAGGTGGAHKSLHELWDGALLDAALAGWIRQPQAVAQVAVAEDAPTRWMEESREVARREVYEPLAGFSCSARLKPPLELDLAYQANSVGVIRRQIDLAGLRLAQLLNDSLR